MAYSKEHNKEPKFPPNRIVDENHDNPKMNYYDDGTKEVKGIFRMYPEEDEWPKVFIAIPYIFVATFIIFIVSTFIKVVI